MVLSKATLSYAHEVEPQQISYGMLQKLGFNVVISLLAET